MKVRNKGRLKTLFFQQNDLPLASTQRASVWFELTLISRPQKKTKLPRQELNSWDADDAPIQLIAMSLLSGYKMKRGSGSRPSQNGLYVYVLQLEMRFAAHLHPDEKVEGNA